MMIKTFTSILFIALLYTNTSLAQKNDKLPQIIKQLNLTKDLVKEEFVTSKAMPNEPNAVLYIIPEVSDEGDGFWTADMVVVKVLSSTGKVIAYSKFKDAIQSDAINLNNIIIDTAPYIIKPGKRAFAVRLRSANNSRAAGFDGEEFFLIEEKEGKFVKVLQLDSEKNISYGAAECENTENNFQKSIFSIDTRHSSNGYFNIIEKIHHELYNFDKNCDEGKKDIKTFINVFEYKNGEYVCPSGRKDGQQ